MNGIEPSKRSGCLTAAMWGCGGMLALAVLVTVLVLVNLEQIKSSKPYQNVVSKVEKGKEAFGQMMELRTELMSRFPAENIQMTITGDVLVIQVFNPTFLESDKADWDRSAREIARIAAGHGELMEYVQTIRVVYTGSLDFNKEDLVQN
jgi:hypothetical protein